MNRQDAPILVGDIGGTHTRLALAERTDAAVTLRRGARFLNAEYADLDAVLRQYLADVFARDMPKESGEIIASAAEQSRNPVRTGVAGSPRHYIAGDDGINQPSPNSPATLLRPRLACLAVAGPTDGRHARLTNLTWRLDADTLATEFDFDQVELINDFLAVGFGLAALSADDLAVLQPGRARAEAPRLALGAGTGLGVVQCVRGTDGLRPQASEGGHIGFAPVDDEQVALLRFLQAEYGRVSVERILSGPGIEMLYAYCRAASGRPLKLPRTATEVSAAASAGNDPAATWALRLFARILGQTAGDLALVSRAEGGVYLAGGIAAKVLPHLQEPDFLAGFTDKGRFSDWMKTLPVAVVLDPDLGLKGTALAAGRAA